MMWAVWACHLLLLVMVGVGDARSHAHAPPTLPGGGDINPVGDKPTLWAQWGNLKEQLRSVEGRLEEEEEGEEDTTSSHTRHRRTLFPVGYKGCSCADLAALAAQITIFEEEVKNIGELENRLSLVATSIKKLGAMVDSGVKGPQGPDGLPWAPRTPRAPRTSRTQGTEGRLYPGGQGLTGQEGRTRGGAPRQERAPGPARSPGGTGTRDVDHPPPPLTTPPEGKWGPQGGGRGVVCTIPICLTSQREGGGVEEGGNKPPTTINIPPPMKYTPRPSPPPLSRDL